MGHIGPHVTLNDPAFVHDSALLYGRITIGAGSSVFPNVVMRSEAYEIIIGERTNIQDFVMIHIGDFGPTLVGDDCSIAHRATLHGCEIGDRCLVGINATIMDGVRLGSGSIVAGHAIVTKGKTFSENSVLAGVPAKKIGERDSSRRTLMNARLYSVIASNYAAGVELLSDEQLALLTGHAEVSPET